MNRVARAGASVLLALGWLLAGAAAGTGGAVAAVDPSPVAVELDRTQVDAGPGEKIRFTSTLVNQGDEALTGLVAHVSILTSDPDVYVDPEDWSPRRTQYVDELAPGDSTELSWDVQAVTAGPLILYVTVTDAGLDTVGASGPIEMSVGGQRVVNAQGVLPVVLWPPGLVLAVLGATLLRRRRHR